MVRNLFIVIALALTVFCAASAAMAGAIFLGPGPWITGNDTGGIIPYSPDLEGGVYHGMAADHCARWNRLAQVTSVHRQYGDYISFVCIDRPGVIH